MSTLTKLLIFQIFIIHISLLSTTQYKEIKEFEKVKIENQISSFQFQYTPKEDEEIINSDLLINIENNFNLNYEINITICIYNYNPDYQKGDSKCITIEDSKTLIFTEPVIKDIQSEYFIKVFSKDKYIDSDEKIEFYLFFSSHQIKFDSNSNGYVFKFDNNFSPKDYSQDYLEFINPSYNIDKILKIKIKFWDDIEDDIENLFIIKNLETKKSISYNSPKFTSKIEKNTKNLITINYLFVIKILYIFFDDEIIDLTNVKNNQFFIFNEQTFSLNLFKNQIGFLIYPSESVLKGEISFYLNKTEKYKSRELETDKTCFYIEKINGILKYFINIKTNDYVVYKFILMENFEIINESKNRIVPHNSMKYFIFPYNERKIDNNDYYYGIKIGYDIIYKSELNMSIIKESKNIRNFPEENTDFLLFKNHFIIKFVTSENDNFIIQTYYSKTISNNIKIYSINNPDIMNIFSNKEIYIHPRIDEYLLLYNVYGKDIGFNIDGDGSLYYYNEEVNFDIIEKGLKYESVDEYFDSIYYNYIFIHLTIESNEYYQLNMYPEIENLDLKFNSYYLNSGEFSIDTDIAITLKYKRPKHESDGISIKHNGKTTQILLKNYNDLTKFFTKEDKQLDIETITYLEKPEIIFITKKYINESIRIIGSNKCIKIIFPNIKNDFIFYYGYGFKNNNEFYSNNMFEYKPSQNSENEVRFYFDNKKYFNAEKIKLYGYNKNNYPDDIKYEEYDLYDEYNLVIDKSYITKKGNLFINIFYKYFMINKCKNKEIKLHLGGNFKFYFDKEINKSTYFNFSKYSKNDILEIEANEDYLIFPGKDEREHKNITSYTEIYDSTIFYFRYKEIDYSILNKRRIFYIFAPKTDYYIENFKNECFLFKICEGKITDTNILKTEIKNFKDVLKEEYNEYIATIVISGYNNDDTIYDHYNYYFYNTIVIKVSQKVLDEAFEFWTQNRIIFLVVGILIGLLIIGTIITVYIKKRNKQLINSSNMIEKLDEKFNLLN